MSKWYDKNQLLSHRAYFNLLIGHRGVGKTFGFKRWCIDDFKKSGKQFVWVRRFGTEIEMMKKSFFDDVATYYPDDKFEVKGNKKTGKFYKCLFFLCDAIFSGIVVLFGCSILYFK